MEDKILIFFSVAYVVVCAAFYHWAEKEEKTNPPAKCREPFPSWVPNDLTKKEGDALASKKVWWLWQGLTGMAGVVAILTEIPLLLLATTIAGLWVTIYHGAQRFIAARQSGWWIFAILFVDIVMFTIEPFFLGPITSIITGIYVGVLPDKE